MPTDTSHTPTALNMPVVDGGLARIPFFSGRVLTAEDLQTEQAAHAAQHRRLGRALGTGILDGLFVRKKSDTTVTVQPGRALAPSGQVVALPSETDVSVVSSIEGSRTAGTKGTFADCATQTATVTAGTGAYILVARPASEQKGRVPKTDLGGDGAAGTCGAKHRVEGAKLSLVRLDTRDDDLVPAPIREGLNDVRGEVDADPDGDERPARRDVSMLRNLLAHACLRTPQAVRETADLHTALREAARGEAGAETEAAPAGPTDVQAYSDVGDDAVPIGLLYWAQDRILFVDVWSVRRRLHRPDPQNSLPATARRRAETEAAILQFQAHVAELAPSAGAASVAADVDASDYFRFLPPVGTIPVTDFGAQKGFDHEAFFQSCAVRDSVPSKEDRRAIEYVEGQHVPALFEQAGQYAPIDLRDNTLIRLYWMRENLQAVRRGEATAAVLFASGYLPDVAEARFNLSHWNHARFKEPRGG